jgi:hypothetical protein
MVVHEEIQEFFFGTNYTLYMLIVVLKLFYMWWNVEKNIYKVYAKILFDYLDKAILFDCSNINTDCPPSSDSVKLKR